MVLQTKKIETDRVTKINIRPYDQVFALTQYAINTGLQTHWKRLQEADRMLPEDEQKFGEFSVGTGDFFITGAVLDYPRIVVEAGDEEGLSRVLYMMCFASGKFELETNVKLPNGNLVMDKKTGRPKKETTTLDLAGWMIPFAMQLGLTLNDRQSDDFKTHVLKAGDYSLHQLMARFDTAVLKEKLGVYGKQSWEQIPSNQQDALKWTFESLKENLLARLQAGGLETVGSVLKSTKEIDPNVPSMRFEPNKIQYQTYPWIDPKIMGEFKPSCGLRGNQRLNYLLYCETTGKNELPPVHERMLKRNGNWTDGRLEAEANAENTDFGSFHMARENFFDGYLLKKLRFLNKVMEPYGTFLHIQLKDIVNIIPTWDSDLTIGTNPTPLEDKHYDWVKQSDTEWVFTSKKEFPRVEDRAGYKGWSGQAFADCKADVQNIVKFTPGLDLVKVSGKTSFTYNYHFTDKKIIGQNKEYDKALEFDITWNLKLDIEAVDDGGLQILAVFDEPKIEEKKDTLGGLFGKANELRDAAKNAVKKTAELKHALAKDLANKQGLILPAAGVFFFKNPILSWRGDLICSIAYSELQPEKAFDPKDTTKVNEKANKRADF